MDGRPPCGPRIDIAPLSAARSANAAARPGSGSAASGEATGSSCGTSTSRPIIPGAGACRARNGHRHGKRMAGYAFPGLNSNSEKASSSVSIAKAEVVALKLGPTHFTG